LKPLVLAAQYRPMPDGASLYETDFHAWSMQQAAVLRAAGQAGSNLALDFANLAEEVEDLARAHRTELRRRIETIIENLLKLQFSCFPGPRAGWRNTVRRSRLEIAALVAENPSLRPLLPATIAAAQAITEIAAAELAEQGEAEAAAAVRRHGGAYTLEQVTGDWFPDPPA
jgi:predicted protein tyrosine phosphatase